MELFSKYLLNEMLDFSNDKAFELKVKHIYSLCVRQRHFELANKIAKKYSGYFKSSDMATAFGYMLMAQMKRP